MLQNKRFFCSWSGGKDSCLALYRAIEEGGTPQLLLTMFREDGVRSRSHGLDMNIVKAQARSLNIPLRICSTSWDDYENVFIDALKDIKSEEIDVGVFGDIDLEPHREWVVRVSSMARIKAYHPLWNEKRLDLLNEFINLGFKAVVVTLRDDIPDKTLLGKPLDRKMIAYFSRLSVDPCGENGEFHTVVVDGPIFSNPIAIETRGTVYSHGYWFADIRRGSPK